jgi:nucleotide-binding universal stress UspA family protein
MTHPGFDRILVPTDFSETAGHALRYASELARASGARLTVLYSDLFTPPIDYTAVIGGWNENALPQMKARAEEQLQRDAEANIDPSVLYDTAVRIAAPLDGILAQARESEAELIVMGTHGRTGFRRLVIGSVTESVMRQAKVPVLAVPPHGDATAAIKTIVCPVIYNEQCAAALTFAARIAPPDAQFIVLRASPAKDFTSSADDLFALRQWVPESIAGRCKLRMLGDERVANQIESLARSTHADLIVAAEPADRSAADVLHGTFAARLVQHSECPVLTVNGPAGKVASRVTREEERTEAAVAHR